MIILDTNVLAALMRQAPDKKVVAWLDNQPRTSIWTTSVTLLEIRFALQSLPAGKRRASLIQGFAELLDKIGRRVIPFDVAAALRANELMVSRHKNGRPNNLRDAMIAGMALAHRATLATRNAADFADFGVKLINPWAA
jgi:hypothetical protein